MWKGVKGAAKSYFYDVNNQVILEYKINDIGTDSGQNSEIMKLLLRIIDNTTYNFFNTYKHPDPNKQDEEKLSRAN